MITATEAKIEATEAKIQALETMMEEAQRAQLAYHQEVTTPPGANSPTADNNMQGCVFSREYRIRM